MHTRLRESHVRVAHRDQAIANARAPAPVVTGDLAHRTGDIVAKGVGDVAACANRTLLFALAARAGTKHRRRLGGSLDRRRVVRSGRAGDAHPHAKQQGTEEPTDWPCSSPESARVARSHVRHTANPVALLSHQPAKFPPSFPADPAHLEHFAKRADSNMQGQQNSCSCAPTCGDSTPSHDRPRTRGSCSCSCTNMTLGAVSAHRRPAPISACECSSARVLRRVLAPKM